MARTDITTANTSPNILVAYHRAVLIDERAAPRYTIKPKDIYTRLSKNIFLPGASENTPGFEAYKKNNTHVKPILIMMAMTVAANFVSSIMALGMERCIVNDQVLKNEGTKNCLTANTKPRPADEKASKEPKSLRGSLLTRL